MEDVELRWGALSERYSWKSETTKGSGSTFRQDPPGRSWAISEVLLQRSPCYGLMGY